MSTETKKPSTTKEQPTLEGLTERQLIAKLAIKKEKLAVHIGALAKDGKNTFSNYNYISNEQMITAIRNKCLEHSLSIFPSVVDYKETESLNEKGKQVIRTIVKMRFMITDLETGHIEIIPFFGAEQDTGGKSMQQAITQCTKYFYFKLFNVTSQDEKDSDQQTTTVQPKQVEPPKPQLPPPLTEVPTLTEEQFKKAFESDVKGITATLKAIDSGKRKATSNQYNKLKIQLQKLTKSNQ